MDAAQSYDLALMWNWEYDGLFVESILGSAERAGVSVLEIGADTVEESFELYKEKKVRFRFLLDRASDADESFHPFARYLLRRFRTGESSQPRILNPQDLQHRASDKATMHLEFLSKGIEVPYTIIISPYNRKREPEFSLTELAKLGRPFIIKPANTTGGGVGVVLGAETLKQILDARQFNKSDKYLLQETIKPATILGRRAWFRVFFAFGDIIPCWWDDTTHVYSEADEPLEGLIGAARLGEIVRKIQEVNGLDFFSTEIAYTAEGRFVVVDYVNEICDMRPQSKHPDGVPDAVVRRIVERMVEKINSPAACYR